MTLTPQFRSRGRGRHRKVYPLSKMEARRILDMFRDSAEASPEDEWQGENLKLYKRLERFSDLAEIRSQISELRSKEASAKFDRGLGFPDDADEAEIRRIKHEQGWD